MRRIYVNRKNTGIGPVIDADREQSLTRLINRSNRIKNNRKNKIIECD